MPSPSRIALVGTAGSGKSAPFNDPSWEIWGVGARAQYVTRATRWFELHRLDGENPDWAKEWRSGIRSWSNECEIVMLYPEPDLGPNVVELPHERLTRRFGSYFMTSSFSWMMADAIDQMRPQGGSPQVEDCTIGLWGVDMEYGTEYREQRVGLRHFIDVARVLGISVSRIASSGISYEPTPYPLIQDDPLTTKLDLRRRVAATNIATFEDSKRITDIMTATNRGALNEIAMMGQDGYDPSARVKILNRDIANLQKTSDRITADIAHWEGIRSEQEWLRDYLSP